MEILMREISNIKNDVVFTGSWVARIHNKLRRQPKDIDIVVTSLDGLERFGDIICNDTKSIFGRDSKRCVINSKDFKLDIWVKDSLPQYDIIKGMKFETIESQKKLYKDIINSTDDKFIINIVSKKLDILN